jgi:hypothetical protein
MKEKKQIHLEQNFMGFSSEFASFSLSWKPMNWYLGLLLAVYWLKNSSVNKYEGFVSAGLEVT